jgi:hypothetical protein
VTIHPKTPQQILEDVLKQKEMRESMSLTFEQKLVVLVLLQQKAFAMGKTRVPPWPVKFPSDGR